MEKTNKELKEKRKQKLPSVTAFSPRNSLSELSSPLGLSKEFFLLLRQYEEGMLDAFLQEDDIDYHFNKVKCRKIEMMMPKLMKMVESEMEGMRR